MAIRINDVHAINIISKASQMQFVPHLHHCIAEYNSKDQLVGGCLFTDWNIASVNIHTALFGNKLLLGRQLLWLTFQYPFNQLRCKKLIALVPEWNVAARNLDLKLGFKIEYKMDDVYGNPDPMPNGIYIMTMMRDQCKWLKMKPPTIEFAPPERMNPLPSIAQLMSGPEVTVH